MQTVIDSLLVTLGLDPSNFKKGNQQVRKELKETDSVARKTGEAMKKAFAEVAAEAALALLAIKSVKDFVGFVAGINQTNAALGRIATNIGIDVHELGLLRNAFELAGGSADDANTDLQKLSESLTARSVRGEITPMIALFQQMNVPLEDGNHKVRDRVQLFEDLGNRLRRLPRPDAANLLKGAGFSDSAINFLLTEANARRQILEIAEKNNAVTEENAKKAQKLQEQWREMRQAVVNFGTAVLEGVTPAVQGAFAVVTQLWDAFRDLGGLTALKGVLHTVAGAFRFVADVIQVIIKGWRELIDLIAHTSVGKFLGNLFGKLIGGGKAVAGWLGKESGELHDYVNTPDAGAAPTAATPTPAPARGGTLGVRNNNPGNLRFANQRGATLGEGGFARFATQAQGIQAAKEQLDLYVKRGFNTIDAIVKKWAPPNENNTAAYIAAMVKAVGKGAKDELTEVDRRKLLAGIFARESGRNAVSSSALASVLWGNPSAQLAARGARASPGLVASNAQPGTVISNQTQVDKIEVHTTARDAEGIRRDIGRAVERKGIVNQADSGMRA